MSGLYNAIFGMNPATVLVAPMLTEERPERYFPRFRDCYVEDGNIVVYTRVGGGNRSYDTRPPHRCNYDEGDWEADYDFGENKLYELPTFLWTYDDDFDSTYGYYVFGVPAEWEADFERVTAGRLDELSDAYVERIAKCYEADAGRLKESLAAAKMDAKVLSNAPDWHGFFDALCEEGDTE